MARSAGGRTTDRSRAGVRAQSSVIGVVLVVAITVMGVTGVLVFGTAALTDAQTQSEIDAAEHAMTQLDSRFSIVALGTAEHQSATVDLPSGSSLAVDEDRGWMNVSVINRTDGDVELTVFNETLGALVYENDGTTIAYQGGGVWKRGPAGGSVMVSPPEFHYRTRGGEDATLTLPLVILRGSGSLPGDATVSRDTTIDKYPITGDSDRTNPLKQGKINVTVHSRFYEAWGSFFEHRTGGTVHYDHDRERVVITLVVDSNSQGVSGGIVSSAAGYTLEFGQQAVVDSYNSSAGNYTVSSGQNTAIIAAGDVEMGQGAEIMGDLVTGKSLTFAGGSGQRVYGNLTYGENPPSDPGKIDGTIQPGADVEKPSAVGWLITSRGEEFVAENDNGDDDITGNAIDCTGDCVLPPGDYYLNSLELDNGDELVLDTSTGDVQIYVDDDVTIDKSDESIEVIGDGAARIYVNEDFTLEKGSVKTPGNRSSAMWVYMRPDAVADFNQAWFEGVVYGPGSGVQPGVRIKLQSDNDVFGGLVGQIPSSGSDGIGQNDAVHFDEALATQDPLGGYGDDMPTVTYMHVSLNRVNVSAG